MNDQSFHEIQLSGKQLVFLFMSAVVLAVVIFLLGVSVGRGVRGSVASASTADVGAPTDTTASAAPAGDVSRLNLMHLHRARRQLPLKPCLRAGCVLI